MNRISMPATRSSLLRLKEELNFAQEGLELLDQKKEVLIRQVTSLSARADRVRSEVNKGLARAYQELQKAKVAVGEAELTSVGLGQRAGEEIEVRERSLMGVVLPLVSMKIPPFSPSYGLYATDKNVDATAKQIHQVMENIVELAEVEVSIERLLAELKKTLKRINALSHIYVPRYKATVKTMEITLEEKEREALFQLKCIKRKSSGVHSAKGSL